MISFVRISSDFISCLSGEPQCSAVLQFEHTATTQRLCYDALSQRASPPPPPPPPPFCGGGWSLCCVLIALFIVLVWVWFGLCCSWQRWWWWWHGFCIHAYVLLWCLSLCILFSFSFMHVFFVCLLFCFFLFSCLFFLLLFLPLYVNFVFTSMHCVRSIMFLISCFLLVVVCTYFVIWYLYHV